MVAAADRIDLEPDARPPRRALVFSVRDDAVAALINQSVGSRVTLVYEQHIGLPTTCFGDTPYFIEEVSKVAGTP